MLDAHQLNVFLIAAQQLNFSEAARRLNMTQPSVSQHIQSLEKYFGMALFERRGRHLALTEAGSTLLPMARQIVSLSVHIEETMASLHGEIFGHLIIGCCTTPGRYLLPRLLAHFRAQNPHVQFTCHVTDQKTAMDMLNEGKLHLTVSSERAFSKDMEFRTFVSDPVILVVPPNHPWASREFIEPEELLEANFICREETSGTRQAVVHALTQLGINLDALDVIMILGTSQAIAIAIAEGIGVGFLTRLAAASGLEHGELVEVEVRGLDMVQDVWIGRATNHPATRSELAFWDFVIDPDNILLRELRHPDTKSRAQEEMG
jgi:DNA-binding transcriptional LysR family regulator